jgi:hypothetical protein
LFHKSILFGLIIGLIVSTKRYTPIKFQILRNIILFQQKIENQ